MHQFTNLSQHTRVDYQQLYGSIHQIWVLLSTLNLNQYNLQNKLHKSQNHEIGRQFNLLTNQSMGFKARL